MATENDVIQAVQAIYNPSTSNEERVNFTRALETFRLESPANMIIEIGFALIVKNDDMLCLIGWNFIEDVIKFKWNGASTEFRLQLRGRILELLENHITDNMIDNLSKAIVAMMEHEWPQNWGELIPEMERLSQKSVLHCAAVFSILRRLVENVVSLISIQNNKRRKDMYNGIVHYMSSLLKMSLDRLDYLHGPLANQEYSTISYILTWLVEICEWVPSSILSSHLNRLVDALIRYLKTPEKNIYILSSKCLTALAERKKENWEECIVVSTMFRTDVIRAILETVELAAESSETNAIHYSFMKALCGLLTSLGNHMSKVWNEKSTPQNYESYLSAVCQIFNHPSLQLKVEALETLSSIGNHEILGNSDIYHKEIENVLRTIMVAIEKTGYPSQTPITLPVHYSNMDYDDDLEWSNAMTKLREKVRPFLLACLKPHFPLLLNILDQEVFQPVINNPACILPAKWEPMQIFSKTVVQGGFEKGLIDHSTRDGLISREEQLVHRMEALTDWNLMNEILSIHSCLLPVFNYQPMALNRYLNLLQKILMSSTVNLSLTRHVLSLVIKTIAQFPEFFKTNINFIINFYQSVEGILSSMQLAQLIQVFAILSNVVESEEMQIELLSFIVRPAAEYFNNIKQYFVDVDNFIRFNGFDLMISGNFDADEREEVRRRKELRYYLTVLEGVFQQVNEKSPFSKMLAPIFPVFFDLNRVIHNLASPKAINLMVPLYKDVTKITRAERETIYCSVGESLEIQCGKLEMEKRDASELAKQYINQLSTQCLNIISLMASKFGEHLHCHAEAVNLLEKTIEAFDVTPEFRIRHWIRKSWKAIILSTPQDRWSQLSKFFEKLTGKMNEKLEKMWSITSAIEYNAEPTEEEMFQEHMTCLLTREYLAFLKNLYLTSDDSNMTPLGERFFQEQIGLLSVLQTIFNALNWRDTSSSIKAVPICKAFVDKITENYNEEAACWMLGHALESLQIHGGDELAGSPLISLICYIYSSFRKHSETLHNVLLQVPGVTVNDISALDQIIKPTYKGEVPMTEKKRREFMKKMLSEIISVSPSELHRRPIYLRPLPAIEKRQKEIPEADYDAVGILFSDC